MKALERLLDTTTEWQTTAAAYRAIQYWQSESGVSGCQKESRRQSCVREEPRACGMQGYSKLSSPWPEEQSARAEEWVLLDTDCGAYRRCWRRRLGGTDVTLQGGGSYSGQMESVGTDRVLTRCRIQRMASLKAQELSTIITYWYQLLYDVVSISIRIFPIYKYCNAYNAECT